ncbi:MAG: hypothetical protein RLZZ546_964 [Bacteroidota bacterium]
MFLLNTAGSLPIYYYTNVITRPDKLVEFIEKSEFEKTSSAISKWSYLENGKALKHIDFSYQEQDESVANKIYYIINSINMAARFTWSQYSSINEIHDKEIDYSFTIDRVSGSNDLSDEVQALADDYSHCIKIYLNDSYDSQGIYMEKQNLSLKPEASSLIIFPLSEDYKFVSRAVKSGHKYEITFYVKNKI